MKIKGLESFKRQIEKRLTKELGFKNEPWVLVDGIEVDYIADGTPVLTVKIRAGYTFQNNHYQYDKTIETLNLSLVCLRTKSVIAIQY